MQTPMLFPADHPVPVLRRERGGVVLADPLAIRVRYILDPASGKPVISCRGDAAETEDWILFVPEELEGTLHLAGEPVRLDPARDAACDRWRAYHGDAEDRAFFRVEVQWARQGGRVFDAEEVCRTNLLGGAEARVLRWLNVQSRAAVALAEAVMGRSIEVAVAVGVDDLGVDVRIGAGRVVRAEFARPASDAEGARAEVERLIAGGQA